MQLLLIYIHKRKQQGDAHTLDNHQSDWFQARAKLKDYRSTLRYDHETNRFVSNFYLLLSSILSAWLQGQVYMDLAGPLTPLHLHLPQYQDDN